MNRIVVLPGDGIGPEVTREAQRVLELVSERHNLKLSFEKALIGGVSIDKHGTPLHGDVARVTELGAKDVTEALDWLEWERWLVSEPRGYVFVARIVSDVIRTELVVAGQRERFRELAR